MTPRRMALLWLRKLTGLCLFIVAFTLAVGFLYCVYYNVKAFFDEVYILRFLWPVAIPLGILDMLASQLPVILSLLFWLGILTAAYIALRRCTR